MAQFESLLERLKREEDERQAELERQQQEAQFRQQVPIGPPTKAQITHPAVAGPITKDEAYRRGWTPPPTPNITLPKPLPKAEVSRPAAPLETPQISSSSIEDTVPSLVQTPSKEKEPKKPAWNVPLIGGTAPIPTVPVTHAPLAQWRGGPPTLAVPELFPQIQKATQTIGNALGQVPGTIDYLKDQANQYIDYLGMQGPLAMGGKIAKDKIAQRHEEKLFTSTALPNLPFVTDSLNQSEKQVRLGMDVVDLMQGAFEAFVSIPFDKEGHTIGTTYAVAREAGDILNSQDDTTLTGTTYGVPYTTNSFDPNDLWSPGKGAPSFWAIASPKVWQNVGNLQSYWDIANKELTNMFVLSDKQQRANAPEQVNAAKNLAIFMAPNGMGEMRATFQEAMDNGVQIAQWTEKADALVKDSENQQDPAMKQILLAEAGRLGAQASIMREVTPLDLYNKHQNLWYSAPLQMFADPLMLWGIASDVLGWTPQARRMAKSVKLANLAEGETLGLNVGERVSAYFQKAMLTGRSKAMSDASTVFDVLTNLLSGLTTKGDIGVGMAHLLDGSLEATGGIPAHMLNGTEIPWQLSDGIYPTGWAGYSTAQYKKAIESFRGVLSWIPNLPSLQGSPTEVANKMFVQGDILGLLTRAAAMQHEVSVLGGVPWGAVDFGVVPSATAGKAIVTFLDDGGKVIGQSAEVALIRAGDMAKNMKLAVSKGQEYATNYAKLYGDFMRNVTSTYGINLNGSIIAGNAIGGNLSGLMDGTLGRDFMEPIIDKADYLTTKMGGMYPTARMAEGYGREAIGLAGETGYAAQATGNYNTPFGKFLNATTLGLAKKGRELRQGTAAIGGVIATAEESMALNIGHGAFKAVFEQEWPKVQSTLQEILGNKIGDPRVLQYAFDRIISAGLHGGRVDVAKAFGEIAQGRVAPSLRSIAPFLQDVFSHANINEINALLGDLRATNLGDVTRRIGEIFEERRNLLNLDSQAFLDSGPGRYFFTVADDAHDVADVEQMLITAAKKMGKSEDEARQGAQQVANLKNEINEQMLLLIQSIREEPSLAKFLLNVHSQINTEADYTRKAIGEAAAAVHGLWNPNIGPALPQFDPTVAQHAFGPTTRDASVAWADHYQYVQDKWDEFGLLAQTIMEKAKAEIDSGAAMASIRAGRQPLLDLINLIHTPPEEFEDGAMKLLSDLEGNTEENLKFLKMQVRGFSDPMWQVKVENLTQAVNRSKGKMFVMLTRYPTTESFDMYNSIYRSVASMRGSVLGRIDKAKEALKLANGIGDQKAIAKAAAILNNTKNGAWADYFEQATNMFTAGAYYIGHLNLPPDMLDSLLFKMPGSLQEFRLLGPSLQAKNVWDYLAKDAATGVWKRGSQPAATKAVAGIPMDVIERYNVLRKQVDTDLWEQVAKIGGVGLLDANGAPAVDEYLARTKDAAFETVERIRKQMNQYLSNHNSLNHFVPADMHRYYREKLDAGEQAFNSVMQELATFNSANGGRLGLDTINEFNKKVLPKFDNVVTASQDYAKRMTSFGMVDFTNTYHPDVLLGLYAPYHYWWTRMGKNALERLIFNPKVFVGISAALNAVERKNRAEGEPARNVDALPFGVTIGDKTYKPNMDVVFRWIPFIANMAMSGYVDPDIANRSFAYANEMAKEQGFPATQKGPLDRLQYFHAMAQQMGLSTYGVWNLMAKWAAGDEQSWQGKIGDFSPAFRTMGYGMVRFANWAADNGYELPADVARGAAYLALPDYFPYLVGREASWQDAQGKLGYKGQGDTNAQFVQDVGAQDFRHLSPLPEQAFLSPEAAAKYKELQNEVATEYFIKSMITWLTGVPISVSSGSEQALREAENLKKHSGYDAVKNPQGSQVAKFSYTDPKSENYVQGVAPAESQYQVTQEIAPGVPDPSGSRPGEVAAKREYYSDRDKVYDTYKEAEAQAYRDHPEWGTREGAKEGNAFDKAQSDAQKLDVQAVADAYPTIAAEEKKGSLYAESGARPSEVIERARQRLMSKVYENVPRPADDAPNSEWTAWNAALEKEIARLMASPGALLYGDEEAISRDRGRHRGDTGTPRINVTNSPVSNVQAPANAPVQAPVQAPTSFVVDPRNKWADLMAEQEKLYGLPTGMLQAIASHESGFSPTADSGAAHGLMQFTTATWNGLPSSLGVTDPTDPVQSIKAAAYYLDLINKQLPADKQNNPAWMAAAYNIGGGAVAPMVDLSEITTYSKTKGYKDAAAREAYARAIGDEVGAVAPQSGAVTAAVPQGQQGQVYQNPNWGKQEGPYTVKGDPITDTGTSWVLPVPDGTPVYQYYGAQDVDNLGPYYAKVNNGFGHEGIDWMLPEGTHINSVSGGTVEFAGNGKDAGRPAYGNLIIVDHGNGYKSLYGHLSGFGVEVGDTVEAGQYIGDVGHTPLTANIGSHLHLAVEHAGENTGPWNTIDPFRLIGQGGQAPAVAASVPQVAGASTVYRPPAPATSPAAPTIAPTTSAPVTSSSNAFPWGGTPAEILAQTRDANKSPERAKAEAAVSAEFAAIEDRAKKTYPAYASLYDEYKLLNDDQKKDWTAAHPMIRALHFAGYDPDQWTYVEKTFGKGIVEKWAQIPPYTGEGDDSASKYYHQYPDVFLAKAWIRGRPEVHDEEGFDPTKPFEYNFGKDFDTAKQMFGKDIWNTVREYYTIPTYVEGGENTAWKAFKKAHPEFDEWRDWWYANLPGFDQDGKGKGFGFGFSGGFSNKGFRGPHPAPSVNEVPFQRQEPPSWRNPSSSDDWRKWLDFGEVHVKDWRR